jgi:hypothetical protein
MTMTLKQSFGIVSSSLDNKLASTVNIFDISKISDILPELPIVSDAGFECHLGTYEPQIDFLVAFNSRNLTKKSWINYQQSLKEKYADDYIWNLVYLFCDHWTNSTTTLHKNVDNVWLEFDLDRGHSNSNKPSFFFAPKDINGNNIECNSVDLENHWTINDALPILLKKSISKSFRKQLITCFKSLPREGSVFQIGVMLPRKAESDIVRLCVENIPKSKILKYLTDIGWQDNNYNLSNLLSELFPLVDEINLNFAIKDFLYPKLGFECYFAKQPRNSSKWKLFIKYLIKKGLCTEEKAKALLNWSGYTEAQQNFELWPTSLAKASALVAPNFKSTIARKFHHIKIVYQPDRPLQAKAYLWFGHRWLSLDGSFQV